MKHLWRVVSITILMVFAAISGLFFREEAKAGTPVTDDIIADTIWSPAGSPYWIEKDITVQTGAELTILAGTEVRFNGYYRLWVDGRILVNGNATDPVTFTSNSTTPAPEDWVGLSIVGDAHINFANVSYSRHGVTIGSSHATVNESSFYKNGDSLVISGGSQNLIRNNTILDSINIGLFTWYSSGNNVTGNNATRNLHAGILLVGETNTTVSQNTLYRNSWYGIGISDGSSANRISDNTVLETRWYEGIGVWDSHDNYILNNTMRRNNDSGIYLEQSSGNTVSGNEISESFLYHGISLYLSDSNEIAGNKIHDVAINGMNVESSQGNRIVGNDILSNDASGIYIENSSNTHLQGNSFILNGASGIDVSLSDQMAISNNDVVSNVNNGIAIMDSSNVTVLKNNVSENGVCGVALFSSTNVSVYHNNLVNNSNQALDDLSDNDWDDGYPSGGNYWSDYAGVDQKSGPNQDQPGSDGIGDAPYVIDADSQDRYPLIGPADVEPPKILEVLINGKSSQTYSVDDIPELNLTAVIDDRESGSSLIEGANYTLGLSNWSSSRQMNASDGFFDSSYEVVYAKLMPPGEVGSYHYCVYAWDAKGNSNTTSTACAELSLLVFPLEPLMTDSTLSGSNFENVTISWNRSGDDGAGESNIVSYEVYRSTDYTGLYELVGNVTANGSATYEWTCVDCGEGNPNNYFFFVEANDSNLSTSSPNMAGKLTCALPRGSNLVSVPLIQSNESIETVLQTVEYDSAWTYDPSSREWNWHMALKQYRKGLWNVNHTMGLWVNVTQQSNLTIAGLVPMSTHIHLSSGWNLVGFPSFDDSYSVADLRAQVGSSRVEGFDSNDPYHLKILSDSDILQAGYAYWIRVESETVWTLVND